MGSLEGGSGGAGLVLKVHEMGYQGQSLRNTKMSSLGNVVIRPSLVLGNRLICLCSVEFEKENFPT